jgi:hypothetical protein
MDRRDIEAGSGRFEVHDAQQVRDIAPAREAVDGACAISAAGPAVVDLDRQLCGVEPQQSVAGGLGCPVGDRHAGHKVFFGNQYVPVCLRQRRDQGSVRLRNQRPPVADLDQPPDRRQALAPLRS